MLGTKGFFSCMGECLGTVMEVDTKAKQRKSIDMVRVLILSDPLRSLTESLVLEVSRLDLCLHPNGRR